MHRKICVLFLMTWAVSAGCRAGDRSSGGEIRGVPVAKAPDGPNPPAREADAAAVAEPTGTITLREALALAIARNPELGVFPYELRAADARTLQAGLRPNPEFSVEIEDVGGRGARSGLDAAQTTVGISQPIELGGKRDKRTRVAQFDKELVQWDYKSVRLDVMREVAEAFATVLAAQERLALTEQLLELSRQAQAAVAQRVQAGKDSPVEELRASVAFSETRIERQNAARALVAARHALAAAWGSRAPAFERAQGDFYRTAAPPPLARVMAATDNNPDLARWQTEQDRRRAALQLEKARAVPDVAVGGGVRRYEETDDGAFVLGFTLPLAVSDRNQGGILAATADLEKARQQYEAAQVRVATALSEAMSALAAAYDQATILHDDVLPKARQAFAAAREGYEQGKFDFLQLLDTQRTLFQTQAQYVTSTEAYHKAHAVVQRLSGGPVDSDPDTSSGSRAEPLLQENSHEKK